MGVTKIEILFENKLLNLDYYVKKAAAYPPHK